MSNNLNRNHAPLYGGDLFARDALQNPFPHYAAIRDLGPTVRLSNPDVLAISRHQDVKQALQSPEILISGKGVGFNDVVNNVGPEPGILNSDGDRHREMRATLMKYLSRPALNAHREKFSDMMVEQVKRYLNVGTFNGVTEIAMHLPLEAVSRLVGLPEKDRAKMLRWAAASFNVIGVIEREGKINQELMADIETFKDLGDYLRNLDPTTLQRGSWAAELFDQVIASGMSVDRARMSIRSFVLPSLDTTIYAMANLLYNLGRNPDQYQLLREDPSLIPGAVLEGVRHSAVARWFARVAIKDYIAGDVYVPEGERVMILYGAANRDPRRYENPDKFDVTRKPVDQLGWGSGPHVCAGMGLAKMEMEVLLEALVKHVHHIEVGDPVIGANNGLYGIDALPIRFSGEA